MGNKFKYLLKKSFLFRFLIALFILSIVAFFVLRLKNSTDKNPIIKSVSPEIIEKESLVKIKGEHFGISSEISWIQIADSIIQAEVCKKWTDKEIIFEYPKYQADGLLRVVVQNRKSNPSFIANKINIPIVKEKFIKNGIPSISSMNTDFAPIGSVLKISGENFGNTRGSSEVLFVPNFNPSIIPQLERGESIEAAHCSEHDFDFVYWSNDEINIRVPDGANSGVIIIVTETGISEPIPFRIKHRIGTKTNSNKKNFVIAAEVSVSNIDSNEKNSFFLKMPLPVENFSQRNFSILSITPPPFVKNYQGFSIHRYENITKNTKILVRQEYSVDSYEVSTNINPRNIRIYSKQNRSIYKEYTKATPFLPADNPDIITLARKITKGYNNPYYKVKQIYNYILKNIEIIHSSPLNSGVSPVEALAAKKADTYDAAILFATLVRASGIPADSIAGIVVHPSSKESFLHWWVQFYLEGLGWVPVDIGMAKGIPFNSNLQNPEKYYFGNSDPFRIIFSLGMSIQPSMTSNSTSASKDRSYAFSNSWEEFSGIGKYNSLWQTPKVISIY